MEKDWIKIFSSTDFFKTEFIRQALIEQNLPAVLINKKDSSYGFGQVELYVKVENELFAREVVAETMKEE